MPPSASAAPAGGPRLAALFWFYKAFDLCRDRVELLRRFNPGLAVYGLYGGDPAEGEAARAALGGVLDDLFLYDGPQDATWRWIHGDQVIAAWHVARGRTLEWDTLVIVQWDMLILAPLHALLAELRPGEAAFSGDRGLAEVAPWWGWGGLVGNAEQNRVMVEFRAWLSDRFGYAGPLWCCLFVAAALPREFLDRYLAEGPPEPGFLEYKLPTLARVFGTPVRAIAAFDAWWRADPDTRDAPPSARAVNATGDAIAPELMLEELARPQGRRAFHPVYEIGAEVMALVTAGRPAVTAACGVCGGVIGRRYAAREMMLGLREPFTYGVCTRCGCVQLLDPPADMSRFYGEGYYSFGGDLDAEFADPELRRARGEAVRTLLFAPKAQALATPLPDTRRPLLSLRRLELTRQSRVLDVGCGSGRLLYLLNLAGFTKGLGADAYLPQERTYAAGLRILRGDLRAVDGEWDAVMLHHAFEHLGDPIGVLRDAAARLAPGGRVLLRLPMADSFACRRYRADWVQLDAPRHLFLHTRRSLAHAARAAGLSVEAVVCDSYELQFWGSEQYRRDIPLNDPRSHGWGRGDALLTPAQMARWRRASAWLNRLGWGDQACVYLRRA